MDARTLVDKEVCVSLSQARRLISQVPESKINDMIKQKRLEKLTGFKKVAEIKFQTFFMRKDFTSNKIRNNTQFIVNDEIVGVAIYDNENIRNTKFYLKEKEKTL